MKKFNAKSQTKGSAANESYVSSKYDTKKQRNAYLRFSVSLLISLLVVYLVFQVEAPVDNYVADNVELEVDKTLTVPYFEVEKVEVKEPEPEPEVEPKQKANDKFEVVKDDHKLKEEIFKEDPKATVPKDFDPDKVKVEIPVDDTPIEDVPFIYVENVPVFPGCEKKKTNEARKKCMSEKIQKHVSRKFNTDLAVNLGLESEVQKIYVLFKIDEKGNVVDVQARGPHPKLEKEAQRVVNLLPKMIPGKQRNRTVKVKYTLPIAFKVN